VRTISGARSLALIALPPCSAALRSGIQLDDHFQRYTMLGHAGPPIQLFVFATGDVARNQQALNEG
jgi:hypothetical protein